MNKKKKKTLIQPINNIGNRKTRSDVNSECTIELLFHKNAKNDYDERKWLYEFYNLYFY